jgi:nucleotide-binding universal stress UspA family protein
MAAFKKLLVPLDGSRMGEVVFPFIRELASRLDMETTCLHICESQENQFAPMHAAYTKWVADTLTRQSADAGKPIKIHGEVVYGQADEGIINYANENGSDFLLMATHGRSGFNRWVLGSVALKVLRNANTPVWLIRSGSPVSCDWPKAEVIVPLDGSPLAEAVLPLVTKLVKEWGAEDIDVVLANVCKAPVMPSDFSDEMRQVWEEKRREEAAITIEEGQEYLSSVQEKLAAEGIKAKTQVLMGKVAEEIINLSSATPYSFIAMSTHGRSGLGRWVYGSIAERVLVGASCPVLLVKPDQK